MRSLRRRPWITLALTVLMQPLVVLAQDWTPTKPVRIVVPINGSTNDSLARIIAPKLQEALGQPFVVDNKPGAGGNIGGQKWRDLYLTGTHYSWATTAH